MGGAIIGVSVGLAVGVFIAILVIIIICVRRKSKKSQPTVPIDDSEKNSDRYSTSIVKPEEQTYSNAPTLKAKERTYYNVHRTVSGSEQNKQYQQMKYAELRLTEPQSGSIRSTQSSTTDPVISSVEYADIDHEKTQQNNSSSQTDTYEEVTFMKKV